MNLLINFSLLPLTLKSFPHSPNFCGKLKKSTKYVSTFVVHLGFTLLLCLSLHHTHTGTAALHSLQFTQLNLLFLFCSQQVYMLKMCWTGTQTSFWRKTLFCWRKSINHHQIVLLISFQGCSQDADFLANFMIFNISDFASSPVMLINVESVNSRNQNLKFLMCFFKMQLHPRVPCNISGSICIGQGHGRDHKNTVQSPAFV